ncbi:Gldg family protein [Seonamhaeicola sp.]|uniref:Gldg family protein n=1 Tax=Seonamhaeicola sp. TaxID=1912245 RepID=UPI0026320075|nr:Gldg family protein [Seonamhaeicola sp.]
MKTILRIARFEISILFYSPIAWLVLVAFMVHTAMGYTDAFDLITRYFKMNIPLTNGVTYNILAHPIFGMFKGVLDNAFFFIPLLTMGLISKEIASGSIKLVMSSPVTAKQLVFGKYLAMLGYIGLMVVVLIIFMIASGISIQSADFGLIMAGIIGFILLTATYAAIGLFISSLTSYQVVAAIGTLALLFGLGYMGNVGQGVPIIEDLTYWLSMSGRANGMVNGLISTEDVIYFLIIIAMFLAFTVIKISSGREVASFWVKSRRYIALFGMAFALAYVSSRPALVGYFDASRTDFNTLTPVSEAIVDKIDGPVKIKTYANILDFSSWSATPSRKKRDMSRFDNYKRHIPQLEFEYVYFYDTIVGRSYIIQDNPGKTIHEIAAKQLDVFDDLDRSMVLGPDQIKEVIDLSKEDNQFIRQIEYNGKSSFVRQFDDQRQYPSEYETSSSIKQLVDGSAKMVFVSGHDERHFEGGADKHFTRALTERTYRESMIQKGFEFESVDLTSTNIPEHTDILVIADPTSPYSETELAKIKSYLDNGGNALILAEPSRRAFVQPIVDHLGMGFVNGELQQQNEGFDADFVLAEFSNDAKSLSDQIETYIEKLKRVSVPSSMGVTVKDANGFKVTNLLEVNETDTTLKQDSLQATPIQTPVALMLSQSKDAKEQRIVIAGDADFLNNVENARQLNDRTRNAGLVRYLFSWLTYDNYPVNADKAPTLDNEITLSDTGRTVAKYTLIGVIPFLILAFGLSVLIRRRKH